MGIKTSAEYKVITTNRSDIFIESDTLCALMELKSAQPWYINLRNKTTLGKAAELARLCPEKAMHLSFSKTDKYRLNRDVHRQLAKYVESKEIKNRVGKKKIREFSVTFVGSRKCCGRDSVQQQPGNG